MFKLKLVYGVGNNDANYPINNSHYENGKQIITWRCPFYEKWASMLRRCFSEKFQSKHPSYKGVLVCNEWLTFSNFKSWMEKQDWEGKELDKDFLGDGKLYSPDTCAFIPDNINCLFHDNKSKRSTHPLGVSKLNRGLRKPFQSRIKNGSSKQVHLGYYLSESEAHRAWQVAKVKRASEVLKDYSNNAAPDQRIEKRITDLIKVISTDISNGTETIFDMGGKNV